MSDLPDDDLETELVDLTGVALTELRMLDGSPLAHSVRRIIEESEDQQSVVVSGFDSSI